MTGIKKKRIIINTKIIIKAKNIIVLFVTKLPISIKILVGSGKVTFISPKIFDNFGITNQPTPTPITKVNERITELYYKVEHNEELKKCMSKLAGDYMSDDNIFGLMLLLSFDYLNYTHICISELLKTNNISEKNLKILKDMIN